MPCSGFFAVGQLSLPIRTCYTSRVSDQLLREIRGHVEHIKDLERQLGTMESENSHTSGYGGMPWTVLSCFAVLMLGIWIGARPTYKTKETPTDLSPCSSCSPVLREPILSLTALTKRFASGSV